VDESSLRGKNALHKWTKKERDVETGDEVLLAEAENNDLTYWMGIVDSVKPGEDGHVQTVNIRYTNPGKASGEWSPPKITTRLIHKIAVIVPVGYMFKDDGGSEPTKSELPLLMQTGASGPEGDKPPPPDPTKQSVRQVKSGQTGKQRDQAAQARAKVAEGASRKKSQ
jgi:hypothetical protein